MNKSRWPCPSCKKNELYHPDVKPFGTVDTTKYVCYSCRRTWTAQEVRNQFGALIGSFFKTKAGARIEWLSDVERHHLEVRNAFPDQAETELVEIHRFELPNAPQMGAGYSRKSNTIYVWLEPK